MEHRSNHSPMEPPVRLHESPGIAAILHPALMLLYESFQLSRDLCPSDPHRLAAEFAVPLARLRSAGLTDFRLRWLILKGYLASVESNTVGDCPNFSRAGEQNGTVPLAETGFDQPSNGQPDSNVHANQASADQSLSQGERLVLTLHGVDLIHAIHLLLAGISISHRPDNGNGQAEQALAAAFA